MTSIQVSVQMEATDGDGGYQMLHPWQPVVLTDMDPGQTAGDIYSQLQAINSMLKSYTILLVIVSTGPDIAEIDSDQKISEDTTVEDIMNQQASHLTFMVTDWTGDYEFCGTGCYVNRDKLNPGNDGTMLT